MVCIETPFEFKLILPLSVFMPVENAVALAAGSVIVWGGLNLF